MINAVLNVQFQRSINMHIYIYIYYIYIHAAILTVLWVVLSDVLRVVLSGVLEVYSGLY